MYEKLYQLPEYYTMFAQKEFFSPEFGGGICPPCPRLLRLWNKMRGHYLAKRRNVNSGGRVTAGDVVNAFSHSFGYETVHNNNNKLLRG